MSKGGVAGVEVWLEMGGTRNPPYLMLNPDLTLKDNLKGKTILEFPVLTVVSRGVGLPQAMTQGMKAESEQGPRPPTAAKGESKTAKESVGKEGRGEVVKESVGKEGCGEVVKESAGKEGCGEAVKESEGARGVRGDSDWSSEEEGEIVERDEQACPSASLRMIASVYSDSDSNSG